MIWSIGEVLRNIIKRNKKFRRKQTIFERVEEIALNEKYGKGRESFVMLLGQYGGRGYIETLIRLIDDPVVCGHSIYALRLLKAIEAEEKNRTIFEL